MYYLREFNTGGDYETYASGSEFLPPNVSYIEESNEIKYNPLSMPPVAPVGASIYGLDGKFYSADEWTASGKSSSDAVGVAIGDGKHSFVIHPTADALSTAMNESTDGNVDTPFSNSESGHIEGAFATEYENIAESDFLGAVNTEAILAAVVDGIIKDAPAAQFCAATTFKNGKTGYLPSVGEVLLISEYYDEVSDLLTLLDGTDMNGYHPYVTSTLYNDSIYYAVNALKSNKDVCKLNYNAISYGLSSIHVRPVCSL